MLVFVSFLPFFVPAIQLRAIRVNSAQLTDLQASNREPLICFPALHGANFSAQVGSNFSPRFELGLAGGRIRQLSLMERIIRHFWDSGPYTEPAEYTPAQRIHQGSVTIRARRGI